MSCQGYVRIYIARAVRENPLKLLISTECRVISAISKKELSLLCMPNYRELMIQVKSDEILIHAMRTEGHNLRRTAGKSQFREMYK